MIRSLAPALLVLALATATGAADPVQTYAYVSDVTVKSDFIGVRSTGGTEFTHFYCTFTIQVPRAKLDHAPPGASPELLAGATVAYDHRDYEIPNSGHATACTDVEHSWQLVTLDPLDHHRVDLVHWAPPRDWLELIVVCLIGVIVLSCVIEKLTGTSVSLVSLVWKYPVWRSRRALAREKNRHAKFQAAHMPRAKVVKMTDDAPPSD